MEIKETKRILRIYIGDNLMLINSPSVPFITVGDDAAHRALSRAHYDEKQKLLRFSSGRHWILLHPSEQDGALRLEFHSASREWQHIHLSFVARNEPVFGVGALDTSASLKGCRISADQSDSGRYMPTSDKDVARHALLSFRRRRQASGNPSRFFFDASLRWYEVVSDGATCTDFTSRGRHRVELTGAIRSITVGQTHHARDVLSGRAHSPKPPSWCRDGSILSASGGTDRVLLGIDTLSRSGVTVSGVYLRDWAGATASGGFYDLQYSDELYKRLPDLLYMLNKRRIPSLARVTPLVSTESSLFERAQAENLLIKNREGGTLLTGQYGGMTACLDMTKPQTRVFLSDTVDRNVFGIGFSGVFADFFSPRGGVLCDGSPSDSSRVRQCELFLTTLRELCDERGSDAALFAGSGTGLGIAHAAAADGAGAGWASGDGLHSAVAETVSLAASGVAAPFIDIGAHLDVMPPRHATELIVRWAETASFLPVHMIPLSPLIFDDEDTLRQVMHFARLHMSLGPYIDVLFDVYAQTGLPPVRHLWLMHPELPEAHRAEDVFALGDDIIVAAVTRIAATETRITLPEGRWRRLGGGLYDGGRERVDGGLEVHSIGTLPGNPAIFLRDDRSQIAVI